MAGWFSFTAGVGRPTGTMAKTVSEHLMPGVRAVAEAHHLTDRTRLLNCTVGLVMHCKFIEYPKLLEDPERAAAMQAGEFWAMSDVHQNVLRFASQDDAWKWVLRVVNDRTVRYPAKIHPLLRAAGLEGVIGNNNQIVEPTIERVVRVFYYLTEALSDPATSVSALVNFVCGMSKMGTASRSWMRSKIQAIRQECDDPDLEIDIKTISYVWEYYGKAYPPLAEKWSTLFKTIQQNCAGNGLVRLATTAQFAAAHGAAVVLIIQDAIKRCPDFNWGFMKAGGNPKTADMKAEIAVFEAEIALLRANPWRMFDPNIQGQAPKLINLGYLAKKLCLLKGVMSVHEYQGLDNSPSVIIKHKAWLDRFVVKYQEKVAETEAGMDPEKFIVDLGGPNVFEAGWELDITHNTNVEGQQAVVIPAAVNDIDIDYALPVAPNPVAPGVNRGDANQQ